MKTLVLQTDRLGPRELTATRIFWLKRADPYSDRLVTGSTIVLRSPPPRLADMLVEVDDGVNEADAREAIQAAALADDWKLANEIATRYGISACLRCAADVSNRPTWRLFWIAKAAGIPLPYRQPKQANESWGEICGTCAIWMMANYP